MCNYDMELRIFNLVTKIIFKNLYIKLYLYSEILNIVIKSYESYQAETEWFIKAEFRY